MSKIFFYYADRTLSLKKKQRIKLFIESQLFAKEQVPLCRLHYIFCSDDYLLTINNNFLNHDDYTDIITFDLSSKGEGVTGEIYISLDRVKENAGILGIPKNDEIIRVIFHGALHLCGYKDKNENEIKLMRQKENIYIDLYKQCST